MAVERVELLAGSNKATNAIMFFSICKTWQYSTLYIFSAQWRLLTSFYSVVLAIGLYKNAPDRGRKGVSELDWEKILG